MVHLIQCIRVKWEGGLTFEVEILQSTQCGENSAIFALKTLVPCIRDLCVMVVVNDFRKSVIFIG